MLCFSVELRFRGQCSVECWSWISADEGLCWTALHGESYLRSAAEYWSKTFAHSSILHSYQQDLEAKVRQIALREGLSSQPFTSITISNHSPHSVSTVTITLPYHCYWGIGQVGPDHETLESMSQMRLQPAVISNVSGREKWRREKNNIEKRRKEKKWLMTTKRNIVQTNPRVSKRIPHMDNNVTSSSQILSSAASDSTFGKTSHLSHIHVTLSPKHQSNPNYLSRLSSQNTSKDVPPPMMSGMTGEHLQSIHRISKSNHARSYEHREPVQGQNAGSVSAHLQARYPQTFAPSQRLAGTSRTLFVQAGIWCTFYMLLSGIWCW